MKRYLNRADREAVICLAACVGFSETLMANPRWAEAGEKFAECKQAANDAMEIMLKDADQSQVDALMRFTKYSQIMVLPNTDPRTKQEFMIVPTDAFDRLMDDAVSDCAFCDKDSTAIAECARRKDLAAAGVVMHSKGDCPYRG